VDEETRNRNTALSAKWPEPKGEGHLAVVGGGPSIRHHIDTLRKWPGEIWAINGAYWWCKENGITATYFTVDPEAYLGEIIAGAHRAVLASHCDPSAFTVPDISCAKGDYPGPTSATAASLIAIKAGFTEVTWFGCESCYEDTTHAYENQPVPELLRIACNGGEYLVKPDLVLQAQVLSKVIRTAPHVFHEESGGLLRAMIEGGPEFDALAGTQLIHDTMREQEPHTETTRRD